MKYIFFGTPQFATIILEKLIKAGFIPEAVVCNPDKPVGRKKIITPPPVKLLASKHNISILQPEVLSNYKLQITNYKPDLFIVAAYNQIIPKEILEIPRLGTIGVHPSLLPKYRGPSPIQTAILNRDEETGTTLYLMDEGLDSGDIVASGKYQVLSDDNYESLMKKLAELSANLLIETLPGFIKSKIKPQPQDEKQATYTKKFKTEDGYVEYKDLEKAQNKGGEIAIEIDRKIRALNLEPGVYTFINNKRVKFLEAKIIDGKLELLVVQPEGKKPIPWNNFKNSAILQAR